MVTGKNNNKNISIENKSDLLGSLPIRKLLLQYAIPAIVATLVLSLYNIVDRIYIGQGVGADAISGLALTFPIMSLSTAFGMLVGAGAAARISIVLGKQDIAWAEKILGNALLLTFLLGVLYTVPIIFYLDDILRAFGGSENTIPYAREYMVIVGPFMLVSNLMFGFNNMMRASGYPVKAMVTMLIGTFCNVILDPIFLFVFDMGIGGVAVATVISQFISLAFVMGHFLSAKSYVSFHRRSFKIEWRIIRNITSIGLSPFLINATASGVNSLMNNTLRDNGGDMAIGAYGIINSVAMLVVMVILGLCQGMQPIVGYNFGANKSDRMLRTYKLTVLAATVVAFCGFLLAELFPGVIVRAFTADEGMIAIASRGMRLVFMAFPIVGFQIVTTNLFQSIGKSGKSIFLSVSRQVLFLIPLLLFFPRLWGLDGAWLAMPASDAIATVVACGVLFFQRRIFLSGSSRVG